MGKKGKESLVNTVNPEQIIYQEEDAGTTPFFLLKDKDGKYTYGVAVDKYQYKLCKLVQQGKSDKETGNVVAYKVWKPFKYGSTFEAVIRIYVAEVNKKMDNCLDKSTDFRDIINNRNRIEAFLTEALTSEVNKELTGVSNLLEIKNNLIKEVNDLTELKSQAERAYGDFMSSIKEHQRRIAKNT